MRHGAQVLVGVVLLLVASCRLSRRRLAGPWRPPASRATATSPTSFEVSMLTVKGTYCRLPCALSRSLWTHVSPRSFDVGLAGGRAVDDLDDGLNFLFLRVVQLSLALARTGWPSRLIAAPAPSASALRQFTITAILPMLRTSSEQPMIGSDQPQVKPFSHQHFRPRRAGPGVLSSRRRRPMKPTHVSPDPGCCLAPLRTSRSVPHRVPRSSTCRHS